MLQITIFSDIKPTLDSFSRLAEKQTGSFDFNIFL